MMHDIDSVMPFLGRWLMKYYSVTLSMISDLLESDQAKGSLVTNPDTSYVQDQQSGV